MADGYLDESSGVLLAEDGTFLELDVAAAGIVFRTPTLVQSSSTQGLTGTRPTDRVAGDVTVAYISGSGTVAQFTPPNPAIWTQLLAPVVHATDRLQAVYYAIDPSADPSFSTTAALGRWGVFCQSFGVVNPTTPIDVTGVAGTANPTAVDDSPSVTIATAGAVMLTGVNMDSSTATYTAPTGQTIIMQTSGGGGRASAWAYEVIAATGATGTRQWGSNTSGLSSLAWSAALRPA